MSPEDKIRIWLYGKEEEYEPIGLVGLAVHALKQKGRHEEASELLRRVRHYLKEAQTVRSIIDEYVDIKKE